MKISSALVLVHSPLVGPLTWARVAEHLSARGVEALAPTLSDNGDGSLPYWQCHAQSVADFLRTHSLRAHSPRGPVILAAHSGAGPLLPAIRAALGGPVAAYLFVDAGIPIDAHSRLDLLALEAPELAEQLRQLLKAGGRFPNWTDEQLRDIVPDDGVRQQLLAEMRPRGMDFYNESIPVFKGWPDAPCGYIRVSSAYRQPCNEARRSGWAVAEIEAGHFHMLVNPQEIADLMLRVVAKFPSPA